MVNAKKQSKAIVYKKNANFPVSGHINCFLVGTFFKCPWQSSCQSSHLEKQTVYHNCTPQNFEKITLTMPVTPLMWKSLDNLTTTWAYLWTWPLSWNPQTKALVYHPPSRKLVPWAITVFLILPPVILVLFLLATAPFVDANRLPFKSYVISLACLFVCGFNFIGETASLFLTDVVVHAFNYVILFDRCLQGSKRHKTLAKSILHVKIVSQLHFLIFRTKKEESEKAR